MVIHGGYYSNHATNSRTHGVGRRKMRLRAGRKSAYQTKRLGKGVVPVQSASRASAGFRRCRAHRCWWVQVPVWRRVVLDHVGSNEGCVDLPGCVGLPGAGAVACCPFAYCFVADAVCCGRVAQNRRKGCQGPILTGSPSCFPNEEKAWPSSG
jgi:hypothetical protein